jgi:hypothetical protein
MTDKQERNLESQSTSSKGTGATQYTYLTVEVLDLDGNKIKSDGLVSTNSGLYVDGELGVRAELQHSNGDFYMMTNTLTSKPAKRFFMFPGNEDLQGKNDYRIRIMDDLNEVAIQTMGEGVSDEMVMRLWSFNSKGSLNFEILFDPIRAPGTDKVNVTRTDVNTWEVVPVSPSTALIRRANTSELINPEPVPFKLIIRKKIR